MSEVAIAEVPIEPAPPTLAAPGAIAEPDAEPPEAAAAPEVETSVSVELDAVASAAVPAERALPFDVDHLGPLRRAVLDALVDADEPLSVARIIAEMPPGTTRGSAESAIKREFDQGRVIRTSPGHYTLAPARPVEQPKPTPPDPVCSDHTDEQWFAWLEAWKAGGKWEGPGNPPNQSGCLVPLGVISKHNDRVRQRLERQRDREAAQARQAAADRELRTVLLTACNGNYSASLQLDDLAPVREVLKVLPLDRVLMVIRQKVDRRSYPANPPLVSWRDPAFLRALAEDFCRVFAVPGLVREWGAAGKAPAAKAQSSPPAGEMPDDIDELRSHHDNPHTPPGPHNLPKPDAAPSAPDTAQKPADASEPLPAVSPNWKTHPRCR